MMTNRIPYPLQDGGSLAMHYFIEGYLQAGIDVSLLAMNTSKHHIDTNLLPDIYKSLSFFKTVFVNNNVTVAGAIKHLLINKSYNIARFENNDYALALKNCLLKSKYDIIQLESLFLTPYLPIIRQFSKAKIVLRSHNIEYKIWERLSKHAGFLPKKWYLRILAAQIKKYELKYLNEYDAILPISAVDEQQMKIDGATIPLYTQTFGVPVNTASPSFFNLTKNEVNFYFLAAMDWLPNQESLLWLLQEVLPILDKRGIHYKINIAGKNMPSSFFQYASEKVIIEGAIADSHQFEQDKDVLLVPLLSGGGVRIKIFQALANAKAIITTAIGVEGIAVCDKEHVLIANSPAAFADSIIKLLEDKKLILKLQQNGYHLLQNNYNRVTQINALLLFYKQLIKH